MPERKALPLRRPDHSRANEDCPRGKGESIYTSKEIRLRKGEKSKGGWFEEKGTPAKRRVHLKKSLKRVKRLQAVEYLY